MNCYLVIVQGIGVSLLQLPMKMAHLLPSLSLMMGTSGNEQIAPRLYIDPMIPCRAPVGLLKNTFQLGTICAALIICESTPEVISMPMQVGNSMR